MIWVTGQTCLFRTIWTDVSGVTRQSHDVHLLLLSPLHPQTPVTIFSVCRPGWTPSLWVVIFRSLEDSRVQGLGARTWLLYTMKFRMGHKTRTQQGPSSGGRSGGGGQEEEDAEKLSFPDRNLEMAAETWQFWDQTSEPQEPGLSDHLWALWVQLKTRRLQDKTRNKQKTSRTAQEVFLPPLWEKEEESEKRLLPGWKLLPSDWTLPSKSFSASSPSGSAHHMWDSRPQTSQKFRRAVLDPRRCGHQESSISVQSDQSDLDIHKKINQKTQESLEKRKEMNTVSGVFWLWIFR